MTTEKLRYSVAPANCLSFSKISLDNLMQLYGKNHQLLCAVLNNCLQKSVKHLPPSNCYNIRLTQIWKDAWTSKYQLRYALKWKKGASYRLLIPLVDIQIDMYHDSRQAAVSWIPENLQKHLNEHCSHSHLERQWTLNYFLFNLLLALVKQTSKEYIFYNKSHEIKEKNNES